MRRRIDDDTKAEAIRLSKEGIARKDVARLVGISVPSLCVICRAAGLTSPKAVILAKLPSDDRVIELHEQGLCNSDIARMFKCSQSFISRIVAAKMTEKPKIDRPPPIYSNFQREEYIDQLLNER